MKKLFQNTAKDYGPDYQSHALVQYQSYIESIHETTNRRHQLNSFFIILNTGLFSILGILTQWGSNNILFAIPIIGLYVCFLHWRQLGMYKDLISIKFKIIYETESRLPLNLATEEWDQLNMSKRKYVSFTKTEKNVPLVFASVYVVLLVIVLAHSLI